MAKKRIVLSAFALVALALGLFASSGTEAGTYKPVNIYTVATNTAGVPSNNTTDVSIPSPDYNYEDSSMYNFSPIAGKPTGGKGFPIGAWMGHLSSSTTLGLLNSACNSSISPYFNLFNASLDTSLQLTPAEMAWTNTATPPPNTYLPANGFPDYLEKYPHFLNLMLDPPDPDGAGPLVDPPPLVPRARFAGHNMVSTSWMLIEVVILSPGQIAQLPGIKAQMVPGLGYAVLTVLNNPVDQLENPGAVSDFCTSLQSVTTLYGVTKAGGPGAGPPDYPGPYNVGAGITSQVNPAANSGILATNTHLNRTYSQSERDFDADGWENDMDPCFYIANPGWDPRLSPPAPCGAGKPGDLDCDGLPDVCDPAPAVANPDQDGDGYNNQQDICPLVADGPAPGQNQIDSDGLVGNTDLGPQPDSIGNACDDSDNDGLENGTSAGVAGSGNCTNGLDDDGDTLPDMLDPQCLVWTDKGEITAGRTQAQIYGTNPGTGLYFHAMPWAAVCVGDTDTDLDGYCDLTETLLGSNPAVLGSKPESYVIDASISGVGPNVYPAAKVPQSCTDGVDNDLDGNTDAADTGCKPDQDGDGVLNANDNCDVVANVAQTDADVDGLGAACDPNDALAFTDQDGDTVANAADNCQMVVNSTQTDTDGDGLGDACDEDKDNDGVLNGLGDPDLNGDTKLEAAEYNWGVLPGGANVQWLDREPDGTKDFVRVGVQGCEAVFAREINTDGEKEIVVEDCSTVDGQIDFDVDGDDDIDIRWLEASPTVIDTCPTVPDSGEKNTDKRLNLAGAQLPLGTAIPADDLGDVCDPDDDNDGYSDVVENYLGTYSDDNCPDGAAPRPDAWPLDQNQDLFATMADVNKYAGKLGRKVSGDGTIPYPLSWALARQDLNKDNFITMADVNKYAGWLGKKCA